MTVRSKVRPHAAPTVRSSQTARRWLLLVHQLPSTPSNLRVRTWRRLQQLGALPIKQAVYVLPDTPNAREDFEWLKTEIKAAGGDASVFAADNVDSWSDDALVEEFRRAGQEAYATLAREIERVLGQLAATRRPRGTRAPAARRLVEVFRQRLGAIEHVDFFGSAGRDRVTTLLQQLEEQTSDSRRRAERPRTAGSADAQDYANRLWVTRPRPGVDRMASAWLIKRFVDADARFDFVTDHAAAPPGSLPFDMAGVEHTHRGDRCTFEVLCDTFGLREAALGRVAEVVHDLDLKDDRYGAPETATLGAVIEGLQLAHRDDHRLLADGRALFEALYQSFAHRDRQSSSSRKRPSRRGATRQA